jgi:mono/diheme cytochrome c family protein
VACGQFYNSNSSDGAGSAFDCATDPNLCAAYKAISDNHCFECHAWSRYKTDAEWTGAGLVVAGSPSTSLLIKRLKNSGSTMPQNFPALSTADYNALVTWIQNL